MIWDPTQPMALTTSNVFLVIHLLHGKFPPGQQKLPIFSGANFFSVGFREGIFFGHPRFGA